MEEPRKQLVDELERYYRSCGWNVVRASDGTVRATGPGGVTWIGLAVVPDDLNSDGFEERLAALAAQRMPGGELCPFELLPTQECADELLESLDRLRLRDRGHVAVYSLAA